MTATAPQSRRGAQPRVLRGQRGSDTRPRGIRALVPSRHALVDVAFAAVLGALVLVGFRTGFLGWQWVLAAGAGLLVGLVVAHVGASYRWPVLLTTLLLVAAYFLLGGAVAVRDDVVAGVLPSLTTLRDLADAAVSGWMRWLTLLPPVDARGPLLALPWLAGLLSGALTYGVARRWRAATPVALAPVVLLGASIALGTSEAAATLTQGVLFTVVLVLWLVVRAQRTRPPLQNGGGRTARLVTGVALVALATLAGAFLGPVLPGSDEAAPRAVVRSTLVPPYDIRQFASPLAGFRRFTEPNAADLYTKEVLRVDGLPAGTPVRFATLDSYDGQVWGAADRSVDGVPFQQVGSRIASRDEGQSATVTVTVPTRGYDGPWLPLVGSPTGIDFRGARARALGDSLWLNTDTETAVVPARLQGGETYTLTTVLPPAPARALPQHLDLGSGAQAPPDTTFFDARIDAWSGRAVDSWSRLLAIARYMRDDGAYTDGGTRNSVERVYLPGHGLKRMSTFVGFTQLAGNDEQYAAALAIAARRLGVPSRVVMGAIPREAGVVRGSDVHAWVEVQESNGAWFALMPDTFMPQRNKKPNQQQLRTEEQKVGAQVPPPSGVNPPSVLQGPDQAQNATDIRKQKKTAWDPSTWPLWLRLLVFGLLLPVLLLVALYWAIRGLRCRRRRRHASRGPAPQRIALVWRDLVGEARSYGLATPARGTRLEQAAALPADVGATVLAHRANAHVFGPHDPTDEDTTAYLAGAESARSRLRAGVGRWRRLWGDVDLRPLLPSRSRSHRPAAPSTGSALPALVRRRREAQA